jgi:hypothetical protein
MINKLLTKLTILSLGLSAGVGTASLTLAQASKQNESRFLQEAIVIIYQEDKDKTFTAQEILDEGYKLCAKMAEAEAESKDNSLGNLAENAAESALRSALEGSSSDETEAEETDNKEMMKIAERFLCDQ